MSKDKQGTEFLMGMTAELAECLVKAGIDEDVANKSAWDAVDFVRKQHGGLVLYIPKGKNLDGLYNSTW